MERREFPPVTGIGGVGRFGMSQGDLPPTGLRRLQRVSRLPQCVTGSGIEQVSKFPPVCAFANVADQPRGLHFRVRLPI